MIAALELPTAFPYFAVIAAIVGSGLTLDRQLPLVLVYNVCLVLPLLGVVATLAIALATAVSRAPISVFPGMRPRLGL